MTPVTLTVAQLAAAGELDLGTTDWLTVDQTRVDLFADATDDHQWIHVDRERATSGPLGTTIAHGYLTLSLVPRLLGRLLTVQDKQRGVNYGIDRLRFTGPVPVGADIRLAAQLIGTALRDDGGAQYRVAIRVDVRGHEKPALVGEAIYLAYAAEQHRPFPRRAGYIHSPIGAVLCE